jgi:L-serine dehydratase
MKTISILNHVLGPVMRGPSSSHTAGAFHIGCMARSLLGGQPAKACFAFDPDGSYAVTYVAQGADRGFAMGLMDRPLTDDSFFTALVDAPGRGLDISFEIRKLRNPDHPNAMEIELTSTEGKTLNLVAKSIGGGEVQITEIDGRPVLMNGFAYEGLMEVPSHFTQAVLQRLDTDPDASSPAIVQKTDASSGLVSISTPETSSSSRSVDRIQFRRKEPLTETLRNELKQLAPEHVCWVSHPVYFPQKGQPIFNSAAEMVALAEERGVSLGEIALAYESELLGMTETELIDEMIRRYEIMKASVIRGLDPNFQGLQLLPTCAGAIFQAEADGKLATQSLHTRAAARALAVMHVDAAMGVVCAAPTGGSAGVIPGTLVTLDEEKTVDRETMARALYTAGAVGMILAIRGTFAAEVAGCQVEIGASGAMAAAAVVDACGGSPKQACDAAAISFQNTMGTVCDLLHGMVEIPCHTRNGAAAASAFVNADLVLGGYPNLIPLDETIDAVYAVGLAMPSELRCTSKGGLAVTPSAQALKPACCGSGCIGCG